MTPEQLADGVRHLQRDETFQYIIKSSKEGCINTFLDPTSSTEERENAHHVVCAIRKIEQQMNSLLTSERLKQKGEDRHRG